VDYNLDEAIEAYKADESWEQEHPLDKKGKGKSRRTRSSFGGSLSGQLW